MQPQCVYQMGHTPGTDPGNHGRVFEQLVHKRLLDLGVFDSVYDETTLRKLFGWQSVGVDFLAVKGDRMLAIQAKYRKTRRREDHGVHSFLRSLRHIQAVIGPKRFVGGYWVSRMKPFDDNAVYLMSHRVWCVFCFESMDTLADMVVTRLQEDMPRLLQCFA